MESARSPFTCEAVIEHSSSGEQQHQHQHRLHRTSANASVHRHHSATTSPGPTHRTHHLIHLARTASDHVTDTVAIPSTDSAKPMDTQSPDVIRTGGEVLDRCNSSDELDGYHSSCEESSRTSREDDSSSRSSSRSGTRSCSRSSNGRHHSGQGTGHAPSPSSAAPTHEGNTHPHPHRHRTQRYRGRGPPVQSAARDEERQRLVAMSLHAAAATAALIEKVAVSEPQPRSSPSVSTTVTARAAPGTSPPSQVSSTSSAPGAARELGLRGIRTPSPTPITASTSTKTSVAMLSVALNVENRSAEGARRGSASNSPSSGPRPSPPDLTNGNTSMAMLLRVPVPVVAAGGAAAASKAESGADGAVAPRSSTASRMSRSSSNDSGAIEASMDGGPCATATPSNRGLSRSISPTSCHYSTPTTNANAQPPRVATESINTVAVNLLGASPTTAFPPIAMAAALTSSSSPLQAPAGTPALPPGEPKTHLLTMARAEASANEHVTHVADVTTLTSTNTRVPVHNASDVGSSSLQLQQLQQQHQQQGTQGNSPTAVDISSSSSVGGHHLSVTEGNAFLKQSGSRREEAFYNTIQPYQEMLVRQAVRQAPHTVEHWLQSAGTTCAGASEASTIAAAAAAAAVAASTAPSPGSSSAYTDAHQRRGGGTNGAEGADGVVANPDDVAALCEARWEAYQQYEAEDMSNLDILSSAHLAEETADGACTATHHSPRKRHSSETVAGRSPSSSPLSPTFPEHQVDKDLVELAARLWWTVRFRHFYRTSAAAYEVQRQAAEAAGLSPPSPSAWSLATTTAREGGVNAGLAGSASVVTLSHCSTPASQNPMPLPSVAPSPTPQHSHRQQQHSQSQSQSHPSNDFVEVAPPALPPSLPSASLEHSPVGGATANGGAAASMLQPYRSVSGTATPCMVGSFAAPSPDGIASNASTAERQYAVQKHRALQLLAAFVPRYHGTRCLFVRDVLRCERRGIAAAAAATTTEAAATAVVPATASEKGCNPLGPMPCLTAAPVATATEGEEKSALSAAVTQPQPQQQQHRIVRDADNDDEDDEGCAGGATGDKTCRMIMLEYVCYRFRRPCVMDIKMGSRQYGLHPSAEKKLSKERKAKLSTSGRYGIRLAGYRRWNAEEGRYSFRSKLQCRSLSLNEVKGELSAFLLHSRELERVFRRQLQRLRVAFSQQTVFRFYTSSLLFVYDAEDPLTTARVTMVDFAYTYESRELLQGGDPDADFAYDVGYLKAIDTLLSLLA